MVAHAAFNDSNVVARDLVTGDAVFTPQLDAFQTGPSTRKIFTLSPDGTMLAVGFAEVHDGHIRLYDLGTDKPIGDVIHTPIDSAVTPTPDPLAFSSRGDALIGTAGGIFRIDTSVSLRRNGSCTAAPGIRRRYATSRRWRP